MKSVHENGSGAPTLVVRVDHHPQDRAPVPGQVAASVHEESQFQDCVPRAEDTEGVVAGGHPGQGLIQCPRHGSDGCGGSEAQASARIGHSNPDVQEVAS